MSITNLKQNYSIALLKQITFRRKYRKKECNATWEEQQINRQQVTTNQSPSTPPQCYTVSFNIHSSSLTTTISHSPPSVSVTILRKHLPSRRPLWIGSVDRASITSCPEDSLTNTFMPHCCTVTAMYPFESFVCIEIEPLLIANMFIKEWFSHTNKLHLMSFFLLNQITYASQLN